jgi:hypothetical protein
MMKKPDHDMALATERNEEAKMVATALLEKVARLIAFARIVVVNTSEGISQEHGPAPILKNAIYSANPTIAAVSLA